MRHGYPLIISEVMLVTINDLKGLIALPNTRERFEERKRAIYLHNVCNWMLLIEFERVKKVK